MGCQFPAEVLLFLEFSPMPGTTLGKSETLFLSILTTFS